QEINNPMPEESTTEENKPVSKLVTPLAPAATVELSLAFGIRSGVADGLQFADENLLAYPCGNYIVLRSTQPQGKLVQQNQREQNEQQRFLPLGRQGQSPVTALTLSPNRRFAAVAEGVNTESDRVAINIVDLQSGRVKRQVTGGAADQLLAGADFASLAFSHDAKYLAGLLTGPSGCQLAYWQWSNNKLLACYSPSGGVVFSQVSFSPSDPSLVCLSGGSGGGLRVLRYADGQLRQAAATAGAGGVPNIRLDAAVSGAASRHCWLNESGLALGTATGRVIVLEGSERRADIDLLSSGGGGGGVRCLQPCSRGFAVSLENSARVALYERVDGAGAEAFVRSREIWIPEEASSDEPDAEPVAIADLCVSPGDDTLAVLTNRRQIFTFSLVSPLPEKDQVEEFEPLTDPSHNGPITGLDVCLQKPLVATCSTDRSVRVWNYETGRCAQRRRFADEAYSVALHPTGHQIAVGFVDKLRLMSLLADGLRTVKEFQIRGCKECAFSNGGHLLAAAHGNTVQVFNTLTYQCVANLKGHSGRVRCLAWRQGDIGLVTGGQEGAVYEWNLADPTGGRVWEHVTKTCAFTGLTLAAETADGHGHGGGGGGSSSNVFAAGTDAATAGLREINPGGDIVRRSAVDAKDESGAVFTSLAASAGGRALFAVTSTGRMCSLPLPLGATSAGASRWLEWPGHAESAVRIRLTPGEDILATVGEDASLLIWRPTTPLRSHRDRPAWSDELLVPQPELDELRSRAEELRARAEEIRISAAHELRLQRAAHSEELRNLQAEMERREGEASVKQAALRTDRERVEAALMAQLEEARAEAERSLIEAGEVAEARLMREYEKLQAANASAQRMQSEYETRLAEEAAAAHAAMDRQAKDHSAQLAELRWRVELAETRRAEEAAKSAETIRLTEEDADAELLANKTAFEQRLQLERSSVAKARNDLAEARSRSKMADRLAEQRSTELSSVRADLERLRGVVEAARAEAAGLRDEVAERGATIAELEHQAEQAAKTARKLESGNFVLERQLSETRAKLEPRERDVRTLRAQAEDTVAELRRLDAEKARLRLAADDLADRVASAEKAAAAEAARRRRTETALARLTADLHACAGFSQDPKRLRDCVIAMHRRHVDTAAMAPEMHMANEVETEFARQRRHQESTVAALKRKLKEQSQLLNKQYFRIMQENTGLLQQVRELTQELAKSRSETRTLQVAIGLHRKDNSEAKQLVAMVKSASRRDPLEELKGEEFQRLVESQRTAISQLRQQLQELQQTAPPDVDRTSEVDAVAGSVSLPPIRAAQ
ncbi:hypothetical protein BOX15_Mlig009485g2, partial [Macrostomum lignano]